MCCPQAIEGKLFIPGLVLPLKAAKVSGMRGLPRAVHPADDAVPLSVLSASMAQVPGPTQVALGEVVFAPEPFRGSSHLQFPFPPTP